MQVLALETLAAWQRVGDFLWMIKPLNLLNRLTPSNLAVRSAEVAVHLEADSFYESGDLQQARGLLHV